MAKLIKSNEVRIVVSIADVLLRPDMNFGRGITQTGDKANLATLRDSICQVGLAGGQTMDVVDAYVDNIEAEVQRRERLIGAATEAAKEKKSTDIEFCLLDVLLHYYTTGKNAKIVTPKYWQITGNQRVGQYIDAMAERLRMIRKDGYEKSGFPVVPNVAAENVTAAQVCQEGYDVVYHGVLPLAEIIKIQMEENGVRTKGRTTQTAVDDAFGAHAWCKETGTFPTEAELRKILGLERGKSQHVHLMLRVQFALGDKYNIFDWAKEPADSEPLHRNPDGSVGGYQNPGIWATSSIDKNSPINLKKVLTRMNPGTLAIANKARIAEGQDPMPAATVEDLVDYLISCPTVKINATPVKWADAQKTATSINSYLGGFVKACIDDDVDTWESDNSRVSHLINRIMADEAFRDDLIASLPDEPETADIGSDDDSNELT